MSNVVSLPDRLKELSDKKKENDIIDHYESVITLSVELADTIVDPVQRFLNLDENTENVDLQILQNLLYSLIQGFLLTQTETADINAGQFGKFYSAVSSIYEMGYYNADCAIEAE